MRETRVCKYLYNVPALSLYAPVVNLLRVESLGGTVNTLRVVRLLRTETRAEEASCSGLVPPEELCVSRR